MKIRNKITGEVFDVGEFIDVSNGSIFYRRTSDNRIYPKDMLEPVEPNWEQERLLLIREIMGRAEFTFDDCGKIPDEQFDFVVKNVVRFANSMINELRKNKYDDQV